MRDIENIELTYLSLDDYQALKEAMIEAYDSLSSSFWQLDEIKSLIEYFPEGQVVVKINNELAGCALSIIVKSEDFDEIHTYKEITGNYSFKTHTNGN